MQLFFNLCNQLCRVLGFAEFRTLWDPEHVPGRSEKTWGRVGTGTERISISGSLEEHTVGHER